MEADDVLVTGVAVGEEMEPVGEEMEPVGAVVVEVGLVVVPDPEVPLGDVVVLGLTPPLLVVGVVEVEVEVEVVVVELEVVVLEPVGVLEPVPAGTASFGVAELVPVGESTVGSVWVWVRPGPAGVLVGVWLALVGTGAGFAAGVVWAVVVAALAPAAPLPARWPPSPTTDELWRSVCAARGDTGADSTGTTGAAGTASVGG
ncbi:MAG TPA: hypothetical protein VF781_04640 [Solirubrobacteraceae bacterium]